ncbi:MAG: lipopolysaccharide assembly LapA domain-containing protein [Acidiferrobacterales bacterium]
MRPLFYIIFSIPVIFLAITFAVKNSHVVTLSYYFGIDWMLPLSVLLLVVLVLGIFVGYLVSLKTIMRLQGVATAARKEARQAEQEVSNLRSLPLKDAV